jgi:glycosyltransferase involved in cell wall biosynthesis
LFGLLNTAASKIFGAAEAESFRFRLHPLFDQWVLSKLQPGDHIISSYGYTNACFSWVRKHGGKTFLDGGNSHPENFWKILTEEHQRWNFPYPPVARHHYERSCAMMQDVDFVLSPSKFVTDSFLTRGFRPEQILKNVYPIDLSCFSPAKEPRPTNRPLTIINTGSLSLRKGTPYLLEAFRIVRKEIPDARLLLTDAVGRGMKSILERYADLPIEWSPGLPHQALAERLRGADIFVLPSLEDGFALTVTEALCCGLPVITTHNTGASDIVVEGETGSIVPICDPKAIAEKIFYWWERIQGGSFHPMNAEDLREKLGFENFAKEFMRQVGEVLK